MKCEYRYDMWCKSNPIGKRPPNKIIVMDLDYNSDGRFSRTRLFTDSRDSKDYIEFQDNGDVILSGKYENDEGALALQEVLGPSEFYRKTYNEYHSFKGQDWRCWACGVGQMTDDLYRRIIKVYENPTEENKSELSDFSNSLEFEDDDYKALANTSVDYMVETLYSLGAERLINIAIETSNYDKETDLCRSTVKELKIGDTVFYLSGQVRPDEGSDYYELTGTLNAWYYDGDNICFVAFGIVKYHYKGHRFNVMVQADGSDFIIDYKLVNRFKKEGDSMYAFYDETEHNGVPASYQEYYIDGHRIGADYAGYFGTVEVEEFVNTFIRGHFAEFTWLFRLEDEDGEYEMIPEVFDILYKEHPTYGYWLQWDQTELYKQFEALLLEKYNKREPILIRKTPVDNGGAER